MSIYYNNPPLKIQHEYDSVDYKLCMRVLSELLHVTLYGRHSMASVVAITLHLSTITALYIIHEKLLLALS